MVHVQVLGPLKVQDGDASIVPRAGKPRQVLALLALHRDRMVPAGLLIEELWGDDPPRSAAATLQTYVLQLRRLIAAGRSDPQRHPAADTLVTGRGGYLITGGSEPSDLDEFTEQAAAGAVAMDVSDPRVASARYSRALALWRGPALADVPLGRVLRPEALGLEQSHAHVLSRRIDADLQLGRHATLLGELGTLVADRPLDEGLSAQYMVALYRDRKPGRALEIFQNLRRALREGLGTEPSPRLQRLFHSIAHAPASGAAADGALGDLFVIGVDPIHYLGRIYPGPR
jgi:DNA-binding SARP family transcriptional activator